MYSLFLPSTKDTDRRSSGGFGQVDVDNAQNKIVASIFVCAQEVQLHGELLRARAI